MNYKDYSKCGARFIKYQCAGRQEFHVLGLSLSLFHSLSVSLIVFAFLKGSIKKQPSSYLMTLFMTRVGDVSSVFPYSSTSNKREKQSII